jgi:hypothetical protein
MATTSEDLSRSISTLSLHSESSAEDWDRSLSMDGDTDGDAAAPRTTPRNSVLFPAGAGDDATPGAKANGKGKRSLSELLRLHAEKGTDVTFSAEEAARVADVLRDWVRRRARHFDLRGGTNIFLSLADKRRLITIRGRRRLFLAGIAGRLGPAVENAGQGRPHPRPERRRGQL